MNAATRSAILGELVCAALINPSRDRIGSVTMRQTLKTHRAMFVDAFKVTNGLGDPEDNADRMIEIADDEASGVLNWAIGSPKLVRLDPEANEVVKSLLAKWKLRRPGAERGV
jgi:hypothetical protein